MQSSSSIKQTLAAPENTKLVIALLKTDRLGIASKRREGAGGRLTGYAGDETSPWTFRVSAG